MAAPALLQPFKKSSNLSKSQAHLRIPPSLEREMTTVRILSVGTELFRARRQNRFMVLLTESLRSNTALWNGLKQCYKYPVANPLWCQRGLTSGPWRPPRVCLNDATPGETLKCLLGQLVVPYKSFVQPRCIQEMIQRDRPDWTCISVSSADFCI